MFTTYWAPTYFPSHYFPPAYLGGVPGVAPTKTTYWAPYYFAPGYFAPSYFGGTPQSAPVVSDAYTPFYPAADPYVLPRANFEGIINAYGVDLSWSKSHACPCIYGGQQAGAPDPACLTCNGRGVYWDTPSTTFRGLITFIHNSPTPDEPGSLMSTEQGLIQNGEPALTITAATPVVWQQAAIYDLFVETSSVSRFSATLQVGVKTNLPYPRQVTVAPTGAVSVYNSVTRQVEYPNTYSVSGSTVTLTGYPVNTSYMVSFLAATTWVAYRVAGAPAHVRPFANISLPRRFRLQTLDLWLRAQGAGDP